MNRVLHSTLVAGAAMLLSAVLATDACAQFGGGRGGRGGRRGADNAPKVGTKAPDFTLKEIDVKKGKPVQITDKKGKKVDKTIKLSDLLKDQKPVALIFGSYT